MQRRLSLGLVVRNEAGQILEWLHNIAAIAGQDLYEIIIVDNLSEDSTRTLIKTWIQAHPFVEVRLIENPINHMASARNLVLTEATAEWVYFTDADCRLMPENWQRLINILGNADGVVPTPKIPQAVAYGGGNITPDAPSFVSRGLQHMARNPLGHAGSIQAASPQAARTVSVLSSCNLLVNRSVALAVGGFDPIFAQVGEDLSLSHRLRRAGHSLWAVPGIEVTHLQDEGLHAWLKKMYRYGQAQIRVGVFYPEHLLGMRGLQSLAVLIFAFSILTMPLLAGSILCLYWLALVFYSRHMSAPLAGAFFIFLSHATYAIGELSAILTAPIFVLKTLPIKIPVLEKQ